MDLCVKWCEENEIYLILDCHGSFGSQNGEHHSGDDTQAKLFDDQYCRTKTIEMWVEIAKRYVDKKYIAGYDLLNEPTGKGNFTNSIQWNFYNEVYKAIRTVDPYHMIIMESCWTFQNLPNPCRYGWENIAYEYHWYNFNPSINMKNFIGLNDISERFSLYKNVPVIIGEFMLGDSYDDLKYMLNYVEDKNWSWLTWTYKTNSSWNWGLYYLNNERINAATADIAEIKESWSNARTDEIKQTDGLKNLLRFMEERNIINKT